MVSVAYLVTILSTFITLSHAGEVSNGQAEQVDEKWFSYGGLGWRPRAVFFNSGLGLMNAAWLQNWSTSLAGGCYGYGLLGGLYNNILFAKATDGHSVSRRAVALDADQLLSRRGADSEPTISCLNEKGVSHEFLKSDCVKAANLLAEKQLSSASHGGCNLSLVSPKDRVTPKEFSAHALNKVVDGILQACSNRQTDSKTGSTDSPDQQVAMLLSKAIN